MEARSIISGATGRNGGHVSTHPVIDYAHLVDEVGKEEAGRICRFRLGHYEEMERDLRDIGDEVVEGCEIRRVEGVCGLLDGEMVESIKEMKRRFEEDWPEFKGRLRVFEKGDEEFKVCLLIFTYLKIC